MSKNEIFKFLNANPMFHLATTEDNKPHVRAMLLYSADENGIVFSTWETRDLNKQLSENPRVELCFNNYQDKIQIRITGSVELVEDLEFKKEIVAKREFLKPWVEQMGFGMLVVYCLKNGIATVWTFETNFEPKSYIMI